MNLASDQSASNTLAVAEFLPQLADERAGRESGKRAAAVRRARQDNAQGLDRPIHEREYPMAEFELAGGRLPAAADATRRGSGARFAIHLRPRMPRRRLR